MQRRFSRGTGRALASSFWPAGRLQPYSALAFGVLLLLLALAVLGLGMNWLAAELAFGGAVYNVLVYTLLLKRNTSLNIIIGGGARVMPVLVG